MTVEGQIDYEDNVSSHERFSGASLVGVAAASSGDGGGGEDLDRRTTRLEERSNQTDLRLGRIEDKLDGLAHTLTLFRADVVTKRDLADERREQRQNGWQMAGLVVAAIAVITAMAQLYEASQQAQVASIEVKAAGLREENNRLTAMISNDVVPPSSKSNAAPTAPSK